MRQAADAARAIVELARRSALASAMNSATVLAGDDGGTTISEGMRVIIVIGTKSFATS